MSTTRWHVNLALGAAGTCLLLCAHSASQGVQTSQPQDRWEKHYYDRITQFERENRAAKNIILVGSSHVEGFDAAALLPGRRVINRGITADRIGIGERGVRRRLESSVFDCNPGFILLENGVNDLGELWRNGSPSLDEIEACYRQVVQEIRARLPHVPLLIVNLFPTRDRYAGLNPMIVDLNRRLARLAADFACLRMDVHTPLVGPDGLLREEYSRDGLHLSAAGYEVWAGMIRDAMPPDVGIAPTTQPHPGTEP